MAERDRFELDLMAALRAYAADAPTEVRPSELARQFAAANPRGLTGLRRWGIGRARATAWLILLVGLILALLVGSLIVGGWTRDLEVVTVPSPSASASPAPSATRDTSPILSLPIELQGTWSTAATGEESAVLTLGTCGVGEDCGRLDRIDDNGEHCTYGLVYGSGGATGFRLETGKGNSFGCGYSGWSNYHISLTRVTNGTITMLRGGDRVLLHRVDPASSSASARPLAVLPAGLVGSWVTQGGDPVVLVLHACSIGEPCGRIERVNEDGQYCVYPLEYRDGHGAELLAFKPPIASSVQCYWRPTTVVVQPTSDGSVVVFWDSWVAEQYSLRRIDGSPAGSAPPYGD